MAKKYVNKFIELGYGVLAGKLAGQIDPRVTNRPRVISPMLKS